MKLSVQDLNSHYGPAHILFDIALEVGDGEVVALLGRNGAGKSTTFRSIVGLVEQRSGRIVFGNVLDDITSDGQPNGIAATNDRLLMPGAAFVGTGASTLAMDVFLGALTQTSAGCTGGTSAVADCMQIGSSSGNTLIHVSDTNGGFGAYNPTGIVLVAGSSGLHVVSDQNFKVDPFGLHIFTDVDLK